MGSSRHISALCPSGLTTLTAGTCAAGGAMDGGVTSSSVTNSEVADCGGGTVTPAEGTSSPLIETWARGDRLSQTMRMPPAEGEPGPSGGSGASCLLMVP